jgi:heme/copper-type cytochrome/quinol oxidase subunit 2
MRNHLHRLERCMLAGAVVAVLGAVLAVSRHKALAAQAAASHESLTHLMVTGIIGVTLVVGLGAFVIASIVARARRRRSGYGGGW